HLRRSLHVSLFQIGEIADPREGLDPRLPRFLALLALEVSEDGTVGRDGLLGAPIEDQLPGLFELLLDPGLAPEEDSSQDDYPSWSHRNRFVSVYQSSAGSAGAEPDSSPFTSASSMRATPTTFSSLPSRVIS